MDERERQELVSEFKEWVLAQTSPDYRLYEDSRIETPSIILETEYCRGEVTFFPQEIIQLAVVNKANDDNLFYLHFQMHSLDHARKLFGEMQEMVIRMKVKPPTQILLCCTGGMTTGFFALKLNESAKLLGLNYKFSAVSYTKLYTEGSKYDYIFLAPQISFQLDFLKETLHNDRIYPIHPQIFASYDVRSFFETVEGLIREAALLAEDPDASDEKDEPEIPTVSEQVTLKHKLLTIALIRQDGNVFSFFTRVYDENGTILQEEKILKNDLSFHDVNDICDTAFAHYPDIGTVSIALPGIINHGHVTLTSLNMENVDVLSLLTEKYHREFILGNDANMIVLGYYAAQTKYRSIALLFQPVIGRIGGMGTVCDGRLIKGLHNVAGEIQYMPLAGGYLEKEIWYTPEGTVSLCAEISCSIISMIGPELLLVTNRLLDPERLKEVLKARIPEQYVPEIVKIDQVKDYMLLGAMISAKRAMDASAESTR